MAKGVQRDTETLENNEQEDFFSPSLFSAQSTSNGTGEVERNASTQDGTCISYGPLKNLRAVSKDGGTPLRLLADGIFNSAYAMAEWFERGMMKDSTGGKAVLELGSGSGLPSLLLATFPPPQTPRTIVLSDYPNEMVLNNLRNNIERNKDQFYLKTRTEEREGGRDMETDGTFDQKQEEKDGLWCLGFEWGTDSETIGRFSPRLDNRYDLILLSDLLWLSSFHTELADTISSLLTHDPNGQSLIFCGDYTPQSSINSFFALLSQRGLDYKEFDLDSEGYGWQGGLEIEGVYLGEDELNDDVRSAGMKSREQRVREWMSERKKRTRGFLAFWKEK